MGKQQVCIIGGGMAFTSDADYHKWLAELEIDYEQLFWRAPDWKPWLAERLPDYDVLQPQMPNRQNAKYDEWSLYFGKILPFLRPNAILIGHSLGGGFLAKYFSDNPPTEPFARIILVAACYDDETSESLGSFKLVSASELASAASEIHLFQSRDDPVVPFSELAKYSQDLPRAKVHILEDRGHFNQSEFSELLEIIG